MKAKKVYEHEYFTRGESPYQSLKIGAEQALINWIERHLIFTSGNKEHYKVFSEGPFPLSVEVYDYAEIDMFTDSLPDNMQFHLDLHLADSPMLTKLPKGLVVSGSLNLKHTPIKELPKDLVVGQKIYMDKKLFDSIPKHWIEHSYHNTSPSCAASFPPQPSYYEVRLKDIDIDKDER